MFTGTQGGDRSIHSGIFVLNLYNNPAGDLSDDYFGNYAYAPSPIHLRRDGHDLKGRLIADFIIANDL